MTEMDTFASWQYAQEYVKAQVKAGKLPREKAKKILDSARENYRKQSYNKQLEKMRQK